MDVRQVTPAAWIQDGWIYSKDARQNAKYWLAENWVWGPIGAENVNTGHWIDRGWIWGPAGAADVMTGFFIQDGWIYGPNSRLPFARDVD